MGIVRQQNVDVLVTCARYAHQIICSLSKCGLNIWATDCTSSAVKYSKYINGFCILPDYSTAESDYVEKLSMMVNTIKPKMLLPIFDAKVIARNKDKFSDTTIIPLDDYSKLELLDNKIDFLIFAKTLDIPMPSCIPTTKDIDHFPVVIKYPYGRSGSGVRIINSSAELSSIQDQMNTDAYYITEYIDGADYSVDCVRWGEFFQCSVYRSIQSSRTQTGPSVCREIISNQEISEYARIILDALNYKGVCGFDFRVDGNGHAYILEANPRYTGGLGTQIISGFNIPVLHYKLAMGEHVERCNISIGTITKSFWGAIGRVYRNIGSGDLKGYRVREDINLKTDVFEDIRSDDITPFIYQLLINKRRILTVILYVLFKIKLCF